MKNIIGFCLLISFILSGCQPKVKSEPVDLDAAKSELNALTDSYFNAWKEKDIEALEHMIADWGIYCGTDPKEFWNKDEVMELWKEYFNDTLATFEYTLMRRETNVAPDGSSAVIVVQGTYPDWSPNIPVREAFHVVKTDEGWQIDFINWSFLIRNEDVDVLNSALKEM
jgi:hypothetical protein